MAIENIPAWPFEPNWTSSVTEMLEWLTDVMTSPTGSEQRRSLRFFPRRSFEFSVAPAGDERSLLDNMLISYSAQRWYLPLWHDVNFTDQARTIGATVLPCATAASSKARAGSVVLLMGDSPYDHQLVEIESVTSNAFILAEPLDRTWPLGTRVYPVQIARLTDQPQMSKRSDAVITSEVRFLVVEPTPDAGETPAEAGPLIVDGLIVNAYHHETGRGGYFHHHSGTSEGQFIFIYGLFLAYEQLKDNPSSAVQAVADYYLDLALEMLDAMGDGGLLGPMLRQPIPDDPETITLMHWLFAARGDVPGQGLIYAYETAPAGGQLTIPANANGASVFRVWAIYPGTSELLFNNPYSPAFDIASPGAPTQITLDESDWTRVGATTRITIPPGSPSHATWKIVFGYNTKTIIPIKHGYEAYPEWTPIQPGYSACAPDTFRWFDQAMEKAILWDARDGMTEQWENLRAAMRRSAVRGQAISDLREVIRPMPGFPAIPVKGDPDGMFSYSDHPDALPPSEPGANRNWMGYDFWRRDDNGDILGVIPASSAIAQVQLGRGFSDQWRNSTSYQEADQYLYVAVSATKKPSATNEHFLIFVSSTMAYDENTRWYADIGAMSDFVAKSDGTVIEFFIPRSAFKLRTYGSGGESIWGSTLPAGTNLQNFGISSEMIGPYRIRLRALRMVSGPSSAWVDANKAQAIKGSKMPFFPGAMPFAINADTRLQQFVGWNGSPFHGYQLADFWWWVGADAAIVHPSLTVNDLPIPHPTTGALTYPISATDTLGATKPKHALLMEQQLMFLKHAQDRYQTDGGEFGPFAHTFVLNTAARSTIGNPTPHTWVYINDDPNTRWVGYQTRLVESLATLVDLTTGATGFATARTLAANMALAWLDFLNDWWPDLDGQVVGGKTIYGMPTDYDNPAISDPQTLYEEPHAAAHIMRACIILKKAGVGDTALLDALLVRCWQYLEMVWRTTGEMRFTWSPDPAAKQWYGFWHGDIITTLAIALDEAALIPSEVDLDVVEQRLIQTQQWLQETGVGFARPDITTGLTDVYRDFFVLSNAPDDRSNLDIGLERMLVELDNRTSIPRAADTAGRPFTYQKYTWVLNGRGEHAQFEAFLQVLRGRAFPIWVPTFMEDLVVIDPIVDGATTIMVKRAGFTLSGGVRPERRDIMIDLGAERIYRRITESALDSDGNEILALDAPIRIDVNTSDVVRVCFMNLMRLNQDSVQIEHLTDNSGTAIATATFRSAPDTRVPEAAFYQ